jgi:hypothetical protein
MPHPDMGDALPANSGKGRGLLVAAIVAARHIHICYAKFGTPNFFEKNKIFIDKR